VGSVEEFRGTGATGFGRANKEEIAMAKNRKSNQSKPSVKVQDISPRKNAQGGKISVEYKPQKSDGTLDGGIVSGYDIKK
jgi:hypothetical protein